MRRESHPAAELLAVSLGSLLLVLSISALYLQLAEALISNQARRARHQRAVYFAHENGNGSLWTQRQQQQQQQPDQCCACDEAKYELVFEGLWSRYTHPDDFPDNYWQAHFSDIIGASHSGRFRMWAINELASEGVRELAETGQTKKLEAELKLVSARTRTIIKARELRYPSLNSKRSAVFRTDRQHHLVSVLSKLGPSPDWMLGVSGLELCQPDCSWATQRVIHLHLVDAGTDSGATFGAADQPTRPQEKISYFRKQQSLREPRDGQQQQQQQQAFDSANAHDLSPETPPQPADPALAQAAGEQLKPFARLTITRQRIYEKSCDTASPGQQSGYASSLEPGGALAPSKTSEDYSSSSFGSNGAEMSTQPALDCRLTDWSDWSACSSQCGRGIRTRTRSFIAQDEQPPGPGCQLADLMQKEICLSECDASNATSCITRDWSEWSRCSSQCGQGNRKRTRSPIEGRACDSVELVEMEPCSGACAPLDHQENSPSPTSSAVRCETNSWSQWSDCSVACGRGTMIKVRHFVRRDDIEHCGHVRLIEKQPCMGKSRSCSHMDKACSLSLELGHCNAGMSRWFFNQTTGECREFIYGGCGGNKNNFASIHHCHRACLEPAILAKAG